MNFLKENMSQHCCIDNFSMQSIQKYTPCRCHYWLPKPVMSLFTVVTSIVKDEKRKQHTDFVQWSYGCLCALIMQKHVCLWIGRTDKGILNKSLLGPQVPEHKNQYCLGIYIYIVLYYEPQNRLSIICFSIFYIKTALWFP